MIAGMSDGVASAWETKGFMPEDEGMALFEAASTAEPGSAVEIGSYCGRSTLLLAEAARRSGSNLFTIDHHLGSEEHQPGEAYFDPELYDERIQRPNSLPHLISSLRDRAGTVTILVGRSVSLARYWSGDISFLFIDGGHSRETAHADYEGWTVHLSSGGLLAIHDVFPNPADGGRPPFEIFERALSDGFTQVSVTGSLRVLSKR